MKDWLTLQSEFLACVPTSEASYIFEQLAVCSQILSRILLQSTPPSSEGFLLSSSTSLSAFVGMQAMEYQFFS